MSFAGCSIVFSRDGSIYFYGLIFSHQSIQVHHELQDSKLLPSAVHSWYPLSSNYRSERPFSGHSPSLENCQTTHQKLLFPFEDTVQTPCISLAKALLHSIYTTNLSLLVWKNLRHAVQFHYWKESPLYLFSKNKALGYPIRLSLIYTTRRSRSTLLLYLCSNYRLIGFFLPFLDHWLSPR